MCIHIKISIHLNHGAPYFESNHFKREGVLSVNFLDFFLRLLKARGGGLCGRFRLLVLILTCKLRKAAFFFFLMGSKIFF